MVAYWRLKTKENVKILALKVVVTERWLFTRGSKFGDLTWTLLVFGDLRLRDKDMGMWGLSHTQGCRDSKMWDAKRSGFGDLRMWNIGNRGHDKQTALEFCAEVIKYSFQWS